MKKTTLLLLALLAPTTSRGVDIPLDPKNTYFHVCMDPAAGNAVPVVLANLGIQPGEVILLENLGGWDNGPGTDIPRNTIVVFSGSATLLPGSAHPRVPDAIEAGIDFHSSNTFNCNDSTNIAQDFHVAPTLIVVPTGATHLFASGHDQFFSDNSDPNGDYALRITDMGATGVELPGSSTGALVLLASAPNPFRSSTSISYKIPDGGVVSLRVVDAAGRQVRMLEDSVSRQAGSFTTMWDGRSQEGTAAPAGVYFCVLESGDMREARRLVLLR